MILMRGNVKQWIYLSTRIYFRTNGRTNG